MGIFAFSVVPHGRSRRSAPTNEKPETWSVSTEFTLQDNFSAWADSAGHPVDIHARAGSCQATERPSISAESSPAIGEPWPGTGDNSRRIASRAHALPTARSR